MRIKYTPDSAFDTEIEYYGQSPFHFFTEIRKVFQRFPGRLKLAVNPAFWSNFESAFPHALEEQGLSLYFDAGVPTLLVDTIYGQLEVILDNLLASDVAEIR